MSVLVFYQLIIELINFYLFSFPFLGDVQKRIISRVLSETKSFFDQRPSGIAVCCALLIVLVYWHAIGLLTLRVFWNMV